MNRESFQMLFLLIHFMATLNHHLLSFFSLPSNKILQMTTPKKNTRTHTKQPISNKHSIP